MFAAPDKPTSLRVIGITSSSFTLFWGFPGKSNGILRSFLIAIVETERVDFEQCCQVFPNIEVIVEVEQPTYEKEVKTLTMCFKGV